MNICVKGTHKQAWPLKWKETQTKGNLSKGNINIKVLLSEMLCIYMGLDWLQYVQLKATLKEIKHCYLNVNMFIVQNTKQNVKEYVSSKYIYI